MVLRIILIIAIVYLIYKLIRTILLELGGGSDAEGWRVHPHYKSSRDHPDLKNIQDADFEEIYDEDTSKKKK